MSENNYKIPKEKLFSAKGWDIGISKPTANGGRVLLLDNNVTLVVGGEIDADGNVMGGRIVKGGIFFQSTADKIAFLADKLDQDALGKVKHRLEKSGADRVANASFEYSKQG